MSNVASLIPCAMKIFGIPVGVAPSVKPAENDIMREKEVSVHPAHGDGVRSAIGKPFRRNARGVDVHDLEQPP